MKVAFLALTDRGMATVNRLEEGLPSTVGRVVFSHEKARGPNNNQPNECRSYVFSRLSDIVPILWQEYPVLIFVMATGIVVRQIAALVKSKDRDPAVLVLDEEGKYIIPLLSGHLGGANAWANHLASQIGARPVITTASDVRGLVAPDEYVRRYGWQVEPLDRLPAVNRLLIEQGFLYVSTNFPLETASAWLNDSHYIFLTEQEREQANVILDVFPDPEKRDCIYLIPPLLSIGVGCRRGIAPDLVLEGITLAIKQLGASLKAIAGIYSIDLKANEPGLIETAKYLRVPFQTFSAEELQQVIDQKDLSRSNYVKQKIGVDGVCEAASLLGTRAGRLVLPKIKCQGVTVAISLENSLSWASDQEIQTI